MILKHSFQLYTRQWWQILCTSPVRVLSKIFIKKSYLWSILFLLSASWNYSISPKFSHFFTWIDVLRFTSSHLSSSCSLRFGFSQSPLYFNVATYTVVNSPSAGSFIPLSEDPEKGGGGGELFVCVVARYDELFLTETLCWDANPSHLVYSLLGMPPVLPKVTYLFLVVYQASL